MGLAWKDRLKMMHTIKLLLWDRCKWDWCSACRNPGRPNVIWCPEYEKRGK